MGLSTELLATAPGNVRVPDERSGLVILNDERAVELLHQGAHRPLHRAMLDVFESRGGELELLDRFSDQLGRDIEFAMSLSPSDVAHLETLIATRALPSRRGDNPWFGSAEGIRDTLDAMASCKAAFASGRPVIYRASW
jgi:hypothetical protein